ncbi:methyltransferase domain-containing protein [Thalassotalea sp. HSM 43]|uniref:class I SAM-dependent methyltransferase n=1 Tax=Thalassotalea sp. HSM 43 TaxID=2552945 RepID=UPI001081316A|nr:class I SAM-dependent methyltransferase [Thalassotalea sp. HSM 43]QBY04903.1 methyltransferase domain-containing protein [Thalassotalea sp. HSM 43]
MQHWDDYWHSGFLTSFGSAFNNNYQGVYLDFWQTVFSSLPKKAKILDLATGNASLPLIGAEVSNKLALEHHFCATDLANIDTSLISEKLADISSQAQDTVELYPNTCSTTLPFADQTFDCVTSQYGFEYSDQLQTLAQISRVSKPNAQVILVTHHADSVILKRNNKTIQLLTKILSSNGLLAIIIKLVKQLGDDDNRFDPKSEKLRNKLNNKIRSLEQDNKTSYMDTNIQDLILTLFKQGTLSQQQRLSKVDAYKMEARSHIQRLSDLKNAAISEKKLELLLTQADQLGLKPFAKELLHDDKDNLLGWIIKLNKSA